MATWRVELLSAIAFPKSACGTRFGTSDWLDGPPNARAAPKMPISASTGPASCSPAIDTTPGRPHKAEGRGGDREDASPVVGIGEVAGRQDEDDEGQELRQADQTEVEGAARHGVDLEADRHDEHLGGDRDDESCPKEASEVAVRERGRAAQTASGDGGGEHRSATIPHRGMVTADGMRGSRHMTDGSPQRALPLRQLFTLSIYWLGIQTIWGGLNTIVIPQRIDALNPGAQGLLLALIIAVGAVAPIIVQPTVGMVSDYTVTRWGRRKPYIVIGALLDVAFLPASRGRTPSSPCSPSTSCSTSSNFAQGPFQGYVPDLVPARQVGTAAALMGLMLVLGTIVGVGMRPSAGPRPPRRCWRWGSSRS